MDFSLTAEQAAIREAIIGICRRFGDAYWLAKDQQGDFPEDFYQAIARDGWLGICIPQDYGGSGLGISEAAIMMQTISESGAGMSGCSAIHRNIFGLNPVVVFGTDEQKRRMLPPIVAGKGKAFHLRGHHTSCASCSLADARLAAHLLTRVPSSACHKIKAICCSPNRDFFMENPPPGKGG